MEIVNKILFEIYSISKSNIFLSIELSILFGFVISNILSQFFVARLNVSGDCLMSCMTNKAYPAYVLYMVLQRDC